MSLPIIKTVLDCADYSKTVEPYLPQLYALPYQIWDAIKTNPAALKQIYLDTNPLISGAALSLFLGPVFLVVSEINRNYSQVDRCWSLLPTVYNANYVIWAHLQGLPTKGLDALLAASLIWSTRLTFNYWRRGGYSVGSEDYRWEIIKEYISAPLFFVLNVTFISTMQSILLFLVTSPTYILLLNSRLAATDQSPELGLLDIVFPIIFVGFVGLTAVADQQQWVYQNVKHRYKNTAKIPPNSKFSQTDLDRGFLTKGLFAWSRHPNLASEQSVWVTLYAWGAMKSHSYLNWTAIGTLIYIGVFQGSTPLTEWISGQKYPEYKKYQAKVGMFLPKSLWPVDPKQLDIVEGGKAIDNGSGTGDQKLKDDQNQARQRYDLR